jgi:hypothetical protein
MTKYNLNCLPYLHARKVCFQFIPILNNSDVFQISSTFIYTTVCQRLSSSFSLYPDMVSHHHFYSVSMNYTKFGRCPQSPSVSIFNIVTSCPYRSTLWTISSLLTSFYCFHGNTAVPTAEWSNFTEHVFTFVKFVYNLSFLLWSFKYQYWQDYSQIVNQTCLISFVDGLLFIQFLLIIIFFYTHER